MNTKICRQCKKIANFRLTKIKDNGLEYDKYFRYDYCIECLKKVLTKN